MTQELFRDDAYMKTCQAQVVDVRDGSVVLDQTVFYPAGGGQPGDSGVLKTADGQTVEIVDTRKDPSDGNLLHIAAPDSAALSVGDVLTAELDWDRRHVHMRMHTAMHLLCALIDSPVTGGQVGAEKSRLDFALAENPDKVALTDALNALVAAEHKVTTSSITDAELDADPDLVRTMTVQPPRGAGTIRMIKIGDDVDFQPCGGTHVASTAEIGALRIGKIENKGKQNRRINIHFAD